MREKLACEICPLAHKGCDRRILDDPISECAKALKRADEILRDIEKEKRDRVKVPNG